LCVLAAEGLSKRFGAVEATRDVSLRIEAGARHAIVGPNGSGKTTLFDLLSGEKRPSAGRVLLEGADVTRLGSDARARRGLTRSFQKNSLYPALTVRENLAVAATLALGLGARLWPPLARRRDIAERVAETAEAVRLADRLDERVASLAYGTQRQLEIGLALALKPKVLLLDEPTAGMSADETAAMTSLLAGLPRSVALVVVEHDMSVVFELAERITVLDRGEILLEGTPAEVRQSALVRERYFGRGRAA
jgi:ABC-type branched-subunit amino acid transport system ATPase component